MYGFRIATNETGKGEVMDIKTMTSPEFAEAAFQKVKPQLLALRADELEHMNVDVPNAASIALAAHGRMIDLRPRMAALPGHPVELLDELPTYAAAAWYAHLVSLPAAGDGERVKKLLDEAGPLRDALLLAAEALVPRGLLDADKVAEIRAGLGNLDKANDLAALSDLFKQAWPQIASKTAVDRAEVDRAATLGMELLLALGEKGLAQKRAATAEARDLRVRAFTLLVRAYEQCTRAVSYLRWMEDDLELYAPSLRPRARSSRETRGASAQPPPASDAQNPKSGADAE
jgi:hypothetical protein